VGLEVVLLERGRSDFDAIAELGAAAGEENRVGMRRIRFERVDADPVVAFGQGEGVERRLRRDVDDLHFLLIRIDDVEPRAVARQREPARDAGLELNGAADFLGGLIQNPNQVRVAADVEGAVAAGDSRLLRLRVGPAAAFAKASAPKKPDAP
jgi:hypothetical protein